MSLKDKEEVIAMKKSINQEETKLVSEMLIFLNALQPDIQEKVKAIIWWENLKEVRNTRAEPPRTTEAG